MDSYKDILPRSKLKGDAQMGHIDADTKPSMSSMVKNGKMQHIELHSDFIESSNGDRSITTVTGKRGANNYVEEMLDMCQSFSERCAIEPSANANESIPVRLYNKNSLSDHGDKCTTLGNVRDQLSNQSPPEFSTPMPPNLYSNLSDDSIREMQAKQSDLQEELDSIMRQQDRINYLEDDDELAEFQTLENEVKIVELNRKLDAIQEKIRMKLFNRLFAQHNSDSSSSEGLSSSSDCGLDQSSKNCNNLSGNIDYLSAKQTKFFNCFKDEFSEHAITVENKRKNRSPKNDCDPLKPTCEDGVQLISNLDDDQLRRFTPNGTREESGISSMYDLTPTTSKESVTSSSKQAALDLDDLCNPNLLENFPTPYYVDKGMIHVRMNAHNRDLTRIDEDEEELPDISLTNLNRNDSVSQVTDDSKIYSKVDHDQETDVSKVHATTNGIEPRPTPHLQDKKQNRPLTLYLPKPNEEIDLIEHVQTMGHDSNILSGDIHLSSISAGGYLYKLCMKSSKKWRKRYFLFDRNSKVLSYHNNRRDLVKNRYNPKKTIKFDDILDVYVDHKLSGSGGKGRSSSKSYVFVLATKQRNFTLASTKAETMRAWIDIMFTGAQSCDYFLYRKEN